jgi:ferric-dicitrate binding protein FerR (iron transport regulator)
VVYLDSVGNGELANQGGVTLVKTSDGKIIYQGLAPSPSERAGGEAGTVAYNTLFNPRGSKVIDMQLADGSHVWLNAGSSITYPVAFVGEERRVEMDGEAYFEVAPHPRPLPSRAGEGSRTGGKMPFIVAKGDMEVMVLGTHFNVNAYDDNDAIKVTLLEGSVEVKSQKSKVKIVPGDQAIVPPFGGLGGPINIVRPDLEETMAWRNGRFQFSGASIENIMKEISRYYNAEIVYQDKIPGQFVADISRDVPVSKLLHILELTNRVHFKIENKKIVVMK